MAIACRWRRSRDRAAPCARSAAAEPRRPRLRRLRSAARDGQVEASYLGQRFPVELPRCPSCGFVYVSEELALGKMLKVEQALEDK